MPYAYLRYLYFTSLIATANFSKNSKETRGLEIKIKKTEKYIVFLCEFRMPNANANCFLFPFFSSVFFCVYSEFELNR